MTGMFYVKAQIPEKKKTVFARFWREDEFHVNGRFVPDLHQATVFPTEDLAAEGLLWFSRFFSSEDLIVLSVEEITRETFDHGDEERAAIAFFASLPD